MMIFGALIYGLAIVLSILLYRRVAGRSLEALVEAGRQEHAVVQRALRVHPRGGNARQVRRWLEEAGG